MLKCIPLDPSAILIFASIAQTAVTGLDFAALESGCSLGYQPGGKK
jgi:hypothetical protein